MALNLVRSHFSPNSSRPLLITLIQYRTHFTKTPNHHTKPKWRPLRREKILDVSDGQSLSTVLRAILSRSIYRISIAIGNCEKQLFPNNVNILNVKEFHRSVVLNTNRSISMRRVRGTRTFDDLHRMTIIVAEPFEPYVPPEGDGKATLMSRDVSRLIDKKENTLSPRRVFF